METALFGYGSLVNRLSAEQTLGRPVRRLQTATVKGWNRRWSLLRDNRYCEKTFALADGTIPDWLLSLNIEPTGNGADEVTGALIEIDEADLTALSVRETRYRTVDVTASCDAEIRPQMRVLTFVAKPLNSAQTPPSGALILRSYLNVVESGFRELGKGQLERFRATTGEPPVSVVDATLVRHAAPGTTPVDW